MGLTRVAITRPLFILMVILAMVIMGAVGFTNLGMDLFPTINVPVATIVTGYPGASPEDVTRLVTKPIEDAVAGISNIDTLSSTSAEGRSVVTVTFTDAADPNTSSGEVERRVSAIRNLLPTDADAPSVQKIDVAASPIVYLSLAGTADQATLYKYADERLRPQLEAVNGVGAVNVSGGLQRELRVRINPQRLVAYGISLDQISNALSRENQGTPGGTIKTPARSTDIRVSGLFESVDDIREAPITTTANGTIRVGDVATVEDTYKEVTQITRVGQQPGVQITITKQGTANAVAVGNDIADRLKQLQSALPAGMELKTVVDTTTYTRQSINGVFVTLTEAIVLTALVLLLFLHTVRSTLIVVFAIPTSLITTMFAMYLAGFTLNIMSTLGLTLVIGVLVDDSIVVLENIFRHLELGETPWTAALEGRSEIGMAAIAITLVDVVVFTPVAFLSGTIGQFFRQFALVITVSTLLSLFISFTLTPMLASRWLNREAITISRGPWGWFPRLWENSFRRLELGYRGVLGWVLHHRWLPPLVAVLSLVFAFAMIPLGWVKAEYIPNTDQGRFIVSMELPPGVSLDATDGVMQQMLARLSQVPELDSLVSTTGSGSSGGAGGAPVGDRYGQVIVSLVDKKHRTRSTDDIIKELRPELVAIGGSKATVRAEASQASGGQPISIQVSGEDPATLTALGQQVEQIVTNTKGARDVVNSEGTTTSEVRVVPDRRRLSAFGLSAQQVSSAVRTAIQGTVPTKLRPVNGNEVDIRLMGDPQTSRDLNAVLEMPLSTPDGQMVRLNQVTRLENGQSAAQVQRQNRQRTLLITAGLDPNVTLGEASASLQKELNQVAFPPGYSWQFTGQVQSQQRSFTDLLRALGLSVMLIFMLMIALYESITMPFVNMFALPVSLVGAFLGLAVGHESLNIFSMIGMIFLMGLVAKNGILLVDYANTLRKRGLDRDEAVLQSGETRLRPIVMTTMALVLGLLPLALKLEEGAELRAGIGWIVIGGMLSSTLLSLLLIPTMYTLVDDLQNFVLRLFRRQRRPRPAASTGTLAVAPDLAHPAANGANGAGRTREGVLVGARDRDRERDRETPDLL